jgi:hypothetical protein
VILIDDYWCFGTMKNYPSLSELEEFVRSKNNHAVITVRNGVIQIMPEQTASEPLQVDREKRK